MATQPVLSGNTLPWPNKHKRTRLYRGAAAIMADGTQITDLVQSGAKHAFSLSWQTLTAAELTTVETAFEAVKTASVAYTDLNGTAYTVTLDGMHELDTESVITANGIRHACELKLREA